MPTFDGDDVGRFYVGIDPGKQGGIAVVSGRRGVNWLAVHLTSMPTTDKDVLDYIEMYRVRHGNPSLAVIEKVGGYIAGNPAPGSAMFNFGKGYGALCMALVALEVSFEEVPPQRWQKAMGVGKRKKTETKTAWKNRLRSKAQQLYPDVPGITLSTCDALLIATFCKRKHEGTL